MNSLDEIKKDIAYQISFKNYIYIYTLNLIAKEKINADGGRAKLGNMALDEVCDIYKKYYRSDLFNKGELYLELKTYSKKKFEKDFKDEPIHWILPPCITSNPY